MLAFKQLFYTSNALLNSGYALHKHILEHSIMQPICKNAFENMNICDLKTER